MIYEKLRKSGEIHRLNKLRHLGILSHVLQGTRLARWDYTVCLLHYSDLFKLPTFNSKFRIGDISFSSTTAALQCLSLIWNVGHVAGTFSIEKGIYRYLMETSHKNPIDNLHWKYDTIQEVKEIKTRANSFLIENDYLGMSRVFSIIKLLSLADSVDDPFFRFTVDFASPLILNYESSYSKQWSKLKKAFHVIRHLSYLTVDMPFSGQLWIPNIPEMIKSLIDKNQGNIEVLFDKVSELLSPIEKSIYDSIYHSERARKESSIYSNFIYNHLNRNNFPVATIERWYNSGLERDLKIGRRKNKIRNINRCIDIFIRSYFINFKNTIQIEKELSKRNFNHSSVFIYRAWNSDAMIEPDELIIDILIQRVSNTSDIGKFLYWFSKTYDNVQSKDDYYIDFLRKSDLESSYIKILKKAIELNFPGFNLRIEPWPLKRFGIFNEFEVSEGKGSVWAVSSTLNDKITNDLVRDRSKRIPEIFKQQYSELMGIRALRNILRKKFRSKKPRSRWFILTASVIFEKDGNSLIEYDGGLLSVAPITGQLMWYGLESKSGSEDPYLSLKKRLRAIGINAKCNSINTKYACVKISLNKTFKNFYTKPKM